MKDDVHLVAEPWPDYELLDSGGGMKLERFGPPEGGVLLARPETEALWEKRQPELWSPPAGGAAAEFKVQDGKGAWHKRGEVPSPPEGGWEMSRGPLRFSAKLTGFKHVGVFPEQEPNWVWIKDRVKLLGAPNVLNLFGYTGIATLAAAHPGAKVTHVDASKQSLDWAHENARATGLADDAIRWVAEDALAFVKREVRRGAKYEGIILDPPAFGRGPKGEVWHIEHDLPTLLPLLRDLLAETPGAFFLMSGYAAGYASRAFSQMVEGVFGEVRGECGELHIKESGSGRVVPAGIYARFVR